VNGNTPLRQLAGHHIGCTQLFKAQLGMGMDVAADGGNASRLGKNGINDFHGALLTTV
jgi:hypothetical protein